MIVKRERLVMLGLLGLAAAGCILGAADRPSAGSHGAPGTELLDLVRVATTTALAVVVLLGPGVLWRAAGLRRIGLGFVPLPGLGLLIAVGGLAWALAGSVDPRLTCFAVLVPGLGMMLGALLGAGPEDIFDPDEQRALLFAALALAIAIGRSLWSLGPFGELYEGTVSRTLVPEGRPDSRISFIVTQLIAHGHAPYGGEANELFAPYNFSSRGPLPGMASTPIVLMSGGEPPVGPPEQPWQPFDAQGFMAYRLAMMTFGCTVLLSLWDLVRRFSGNRGARFAILLGASTPFVLCDIWFTWPKLLAASFVVLAAILLVERRSFRSGLAVGVGYLMHPSSLIGLLGLGPLSLWPVRSANWRRPRIGSAFLLLLGTAVSVYAWRKLNGPHYFQDEFLEYVKEAYPDYAPPLSAWIHFRLHSVANTVVPLFLPLREGHNISINTVGGISPGVVHFFFQYWTGIPFGFGIVFLPLLLTSLWQAFRRWPWPVLAVVVFPFLAFTVYWGASSSGMLREGMQSWVAALLAVVAIQQAAAGFPWFRSRAIRGLLAFRAIEVFAVAVGATLGTRHFELLSDEFRLTDAVALLTVLIGSLGLAALIWVESGRGLRTGGEG